MTSECVNKVKRLFNTDANLAESLDQRMGEAVQLAESALLHPDEFDRLCDAVLLARSCFEEWGLCQGDLGQHLKMLKEAGAAAAKPTGSGGGGYALSVWKEDPPANLLPHLIPILQPATVIR